MHASCFTGPRRSNNLLQGDHHDEAWEEAAQHAAAMEQADEEAARAVGYHGGHAFGGGADQLGEEGVTGASYGTGLSDAELVAQEVAELQAMAGNPYRAAELADLDGSGGGAGGKSWYDPREEEVATGASALGDRAFGRRHDVREGVAAGQVAEMDGSTRYDEDPDGRGALGGRIRGARDRVPEDVDEDTHGR